MKDENSIEEIQKTPPILLGKYLYWDCEFLEMIKIFYRQLY
jgi:hypothetical protein